MRSFGKRRRRAGRAEALPAGSVAGFRATGRQRAVPAFDGIPADQIDPVMEAHYRGLGLMERYAYKDAAKAFGEVHERAPDWIPGMINLAIATFHATIGEDRDLSLEKVLHLITAAIARDPNNLTAHYCRGLILNDQGRRSAAHEEFVFVTRGDPHDGHAWYHVADTLSDPPPQGQRFTPEQARERIVIYNKALEANPYLLPALYRLAFAYMFAGEPDKGKETLKRWELLRPDRPPGGIGEEMSPYYGDQGRYGKLIDPFPPLTGVPAPGPPPRFEAPAALTWTLRPGERLGAGRRFHRAACRGSARFAPVSAAVAVFDVDGDGRLDLFLAAAIVGPRGVRRRASCETEVMGNSRTVTHSSGLPDDRASLGVAAGDFDADNKIDLYLTGVSGNRLYRYREPEGFLDVTATVGVGGARAIVSLTARWLDLDQDGDLDLYVINHTDRACRARVHGPAASGNRQRRLPQRRPADAGIPVFLRSSTRRRPSSRRNTARHGQRPRGCHSLSLVGPMPGRSTAAPARTRGLPSSTSTMIATWTWCSRRTAWPRR